MLAGDVDVFSGLPGARDARRSSRPIRASRSSSARTEGETILAMNNAQPPLDNVKVREAIAHAIDRKAIIDGASSATARRSAASFRRAIPAYIDLTGISNFDPAKSKQMLADAGCPNGFDADLKLPPPTYARAAAQIIQQELAESASRSNIINVEWARLARRRVQATRTTT